MSTHVYIYQKILKAIFENYEAIKLVNVDLNFLNLLCCPCLSSSILIIHLHFHREASNLFFSCQLSADLFIPLQDAAYEIYTFAC